MGNSQGNNIERIVDISELDYFETNPKSINFLTLSQIEARAKPINDNTSDTEWKYRSFDGFLGKNESFLGVLKEDWTSCIQHLNIKPFHLAKELKRLLVEVEKIRKQEERGPMSIIYLQFQSTLPSTTNSPFTSQELVISHQLFNGFQYSLFWNPNFPENSGLNTSWNEEYGITNTKLGLSIKLAGNDKVGLVEYIERFGFFEGGGVSNAYRVDPHILHAILTGTVNIFTVQIVENQIDDKVQHLQTEIEDWRNELRNSEEELHSNINSEGKEGSKIWIQEKLKLLESQKVELESKKFNVKEHLLKFQK